MPFITILGSDHVLRFHRHPWSTASHILSVHYSQNPHEASEADPLVVSPVGSTNHLDKGPGA